MSNEIKVGDTVRVSSEIPRLFLRCGMYFLVGEDCQVVLVEGDAARIVFHESTAVIPTKYLVKVDADAKDPRHIFYGDNAKVASQSLEELKRKAHPEWYSSTEPMEHTEAEEAPCVGRINFAERMERQKKAHQAIVDEFSSRSFDWDTYAADLAKEVALKVANKYNDPEQAAAYAVAVAKSVVKNLKEIERNERVETSKPSRN